MTDIQTMLLIAQVSSAITSIIGIIVLVYIAKVLRHLVKDNFRKIFSLLGIFFLIALVGIISMTIYHFLDGTGYDQLRENAELLWYLFMFISIPISVYGSYTIIKFGKWMAGMKELNTKKVGGRRKSLKTSGK